jgi:hypothetical protein
MSSGGSPFKLIESMGSAVSSLTVPPDRRTSDERRDDDAAAATTRVGRAGVDRLVWSVQPSGPFVFV